MQEHKTERDREREREGGREEGERERDHRLLLGKPNKEELILFEFDHHKCTQSS